jgi:hypothetical protein
MKSTKMRFLYVSVVATVAVFLTEHRYHDSPTDDGSIIGRAPITPSTSVVAWSFPLQNSVLRTKFRKGTDRQAANNKFESGTTRWLPNDSFSLTTPASQSKRIPNRPTRIRTASFALSSLDATSPSSSISDENSSNITASTTTTTATKLPPDTMAASSSLLSSTTTSTASTGTNGSKLRRLKDMMWIRETLEDLTAAEFACSVETIASSDTVDDKVVVVLEVPKASTTSTTTTTDATTTTTTVAPKVRKQRPRKRAVDYEKLLLQLNQRIRDLGCSTTNVSAESGDIDCVLEVGIGMGSFTYTEIQRNTLLDRLKRTRTQLIEIIHGNQIEMSDNVSIPLFLQKNLPSLPRMEIPKEDVGEDTLSPKLYVRDDGTVDWDGALTSGAALRKFGTAVWARINGRESESMEDHTTDNHESNTTTISQGNTGGHGTPSKEVTAKIIETPEIIDARQSLVTLRNQLKTMEREHYKLLNSVISQGQATANVKLATLAPNIRSEIQSSAASLENMKVLVSFQTLLYELERIFTYLMGELGNPSLNGYIPLQDRLNVAEFGLLESQVDSFNRQFMDNDTVDEDVLAVVFEQLTDFKRRLGIDYYVAGLSFDREAIGAWLGDLWVKTKKGLTFYVKGVRLFWNDLLFCLRLINRAAQGYTLKPREVRTIRYVTRTRFVNNRCVTS